MMYVKRLSNNFEKQTLLRLVPKTSSYPTQYTIRNLFLVLRLLQVFQSCRVSSLNSLLSKKQHDKTLKFVSMSESGILTLCLILQFQSWNFRLWSALIFHFVDTAFINICQLACRLSIDGSQPCPAHPLLSSLGCSQSCPQVPENCQSIVIGILTFCS